MTPEQYTACVDRTILKNGEQPPLHFTALGLAGEAGEVLACCSEGSTHDELLKELGDVHWYVAAWARVIGSSFARVHALSCTDTVSRNLPKGKARAVSVSASAFADIVKKRGWHGRTYDLAELELALAKVVASCERVRAYYLGGTLSDVLEANDKKLRARYPDGFVEGGGVR